MMNAPRSVSFMPESPARGIDGYGNDARSGSSLLVAPVTGQVRNWEGFSITQQQLAQVARQPARGSQVVHRAELVHRDRSPSVGTLAEAVDRAEEGVRTGVFRMPRATTGGPDMVTAEVWAQTRRQANGLPTDRALGHAYQTGAVAPADRPQHLVDHQAFLAWKRAEFTRRLDAEARGERFEAAKKPFTASFVDNLPGGAKDPRFRSADFTERSRKILAPQIVGTREELAWLQPPAIPPPVNWNGYWDLCPGHEIILQMMAVSGATPENSPSLTKHFMYEELLSCVQRLQYGTYLIQYINGEPPHERYFYVKPLPLANRSQYCPYLCWSVHKNAHNAIDCIPLCNVMWVTQGMHTGPLQKYKFNEEYIEGPFVGKKRAQCLAHGCFTVWAYDGKRTRAINVLATDPLVFTMWMKLLDDAAQMNAALDLSGSVRAMQRYIEDLKVEGRLDKVKDLNEGKQGWLSSVFGRKGDDAFVDEGGDEWR